jgi:hypothetical protein
MALAWDPLERVNGRRIARQEAFAARALAILALFSKRLGRQEVEVPSWLSGRIVC